MPKSWFKISAVIVLTAFCANAQTAPHMQSFPLHDPKGLIAPKVKMEATQYLGRKCVRITMEGEDHEGLVLLPGTDFQDGSIEADIAIKSLLPPDVKYPGFAGLAFRARSDALHYDAFYLRPGNSAADDQAMQNHSVQYIEAPDFGWYRLRREWPSLYESHADFASQAWTHVRIEVTGRTAKLYLNGSVKPSLMVDGLMGEDLHGAVGLWSYTDEAAYFSNVKITRASPQDLKNGADIAGSWEMQFAGDANAGEASMRLQREGNTVTGKWSGPLGENRAITGSWRNGYVELSFAGEWPKDSRRGVPGPVNVFFAGWIDGDSVQGRMRVEGRSDGVWVANRKE